MHICFMAHAASAHAQRFIGYFVGRGHQCDVISFTRGDFPGATVHSLVGDRPTNPEGGNWQHLLHLPRVSRLLRQIKPDLINAHFVTSYGAIAALAARGVAPVVLRAYGSDVLTLPQRNPAYMLFARLAVRAAASIVSPAPHITRQLRRWAGPSKPILTCQYGIDVNEFHPPARPHADPKRVLSNRAWVHNSNIDTIVRALARLARDGSPARLTLLGNGPLKDHIRRLIELEHVADQVDWVGRVPAETMKDYLYAHGIWVSVTSSDGLPRSLLEAMACGAFPIVSDIAAYQALVEHGVNGFRVHPRDDATLARCIAQAMADSSLRRRAADINWRIVQERTNFWKNMPIIEEHFARTARS